MRQHDNNSLPTVPSHPSPAQRSSTLERAHTVEWDCRQKSQHRWCSAYRLCQRWVRFPAKMENKIKTLKKMEKMHCERRHFVLLCGGAARWGNPSLLSAIAEVTVPITATGCSSSQNMLCISNHRAVAPPRGQTRQATRSVHKHLDGRCGTADLFTAKAPNPHLSVSSKDLKYEAVTEVDHIQKKKPRVQLERWHCPFTPASGSASRNALHWLETVDERSSQSTS